MFDLSLVPTEDLMREVLRRCDHGAITFMRCAEIGKDVVTVYRRWKGNRHTIAGLAYDTAHAVLFAEPETTLQDF